MNVSSGYGTMKVVHEASFEVNANEIVAVVGPNGSGKSTLIKSVFGLCDVHSGEIYLDEHNLRATPAYKINSLGLAYVPQTSNVFTNLNIRENLELGANSKDGKFVESRIGEVSQMFPLLKERANQLTGSLSGGERQMVAIARALMSKPSVVLLDEPTAMLSPKFVSEIFKIISRMREQGFGVMLIEQNARKALELCDRAYVMIQGRIQFNGSGKEILNSKEVQNMYLGVKVNRGMEKGQVEG